jgi:hypothetical protein
MWELICDHAYDWHAMPIDRSPWHSDGAGFGVAPLQTGPGVRLLGRQSRIKIERKPPWLFLRAIRVVIRVRLESLPAGEQVLIAADASFGMQLQHAVLYGSCGPDSLNSTSDAVVSPSRTVPLGRWVDLTFVHDGFASMQLYIDNELAASRQITKSVAAVGTAGISIGNWAITSGEYFRGDIGRVQIWRANPRAVFRDFAQRPIDEEAAECWHDFLLRLREILNRHPECERAMLSEIAAALDRIFGTIAAQGDGAVTQMAKFVTEYQRLWKTGQIDGQEMRDLAVALVEWLRQIGADPARDAGLAALFQSDCFRMLVETAPTLDRDPAFLGMLGLLAEVSATPA